MEVSHVLSFPVFRGVKITMVQTFTIFSVKSWWVGALFGLNEGYRGQKEGQVGTRLNGAETTELYNTLTQPFRNIYSSENVQIQHLSAATSTSQSLLGNKKCTVYTHMHVYIFRLI